MSDFNASNVSFSNATAPAFFDLHIWPAGIAMVFGGAAGVFGNIMILAALFVSPELKKNKCNTLVGNLALCDAISSLYCSVAGSQCLMATANGLLGTTVKQGFCFYAFIPAIVSFDAGALLVLAIGVDRAFSLWRPIFYKNLSIKYTMLMNGTCWMIGIGHAVLGFLYKDDNEDVLICILPTALRDMAFLFWNDSNIALNILVVITYGAAYCKAKQLSKVATSNNEQILRKNRLLTSLLICVCIYIIGWVVTMLIIFLANVMAAPPSIVFHIGLYAGVLAAINVGCNFYVYYARSEEYRHAFKKVLGYNDKIVSIKMANVRVTPVTN